MLQAFFKHLVKIIDDYEYRRKQKKKAESSEDENKVDLSIDWKVKDAVLVFLGNLQEDISECIDLRD